MNKYPIRTMSALAVNSLLRIDDKIQVSECPSTRMIKCASIIPESDFLGWQVFAPSKGSVDISFFGTENISCSDLKWIFENVAKTCKAKTTTNEQVNNYNKLYLLSLEAKETSGKTPIGFCQYATVDKTSSQINWPTNMTFQFSEIIKVLRESGGYLRIAYVKPSYEETNEYSKLFSKTLCDSSINPEKYLGRPVKVSLLLRLPSEPTMRMRTVFDEAIPGIKISYLGCMEDESIKKIWDMPSLVGRVYPEYAAKIMMFEPMILSDAPLMGLKISERELPQIPASHDNPTSKNALAVGKALFTTGGERKVKIDDTALKMHWDVVGMSGTGKSSLLTAIVMSAIKTKHSCTVIDPHGSLINTIINCVSKEDAGKINLIRIGDGEKNPVPIRIYKTDDVEKEEIAINNMCSMFQEIFDPKNQGYVGPRWTRLYTLLSKCSIALGLGGTFQSILTIAQSKDNMAKAMDALARAHDDKNRDIYEGIRTELYNNKSNDYEEIIGWFVSKFQRLVAIPQLRNIFGTCGNCDAVNFSKMIDGNQINLIDLSSPVIGNDAARISGTLIINQLWDAIMSRRDFEKNHILVIDEAHLFSNGGSNLERIIYEGRKFGISLIMAHQNCTQLSNNIREALASTANFSSFRLSVKDAYEAASRFDNDSFKTKLCRLDNFNAVTTLSVNGKQSAPFTLHTLKPYTCKESSAIAKLIEENSISKLVKPYRKTKAFSSAEILAKINAFACNEKETLVDDDLEALPEIPLIEDFTDEDELFMQEWLSKKEKLNNAA